MHTKDWGPFFSPALSVIGKMNGKNQGCCVVKDDEDDFAKYCVEKDTEGNSVLTGDGGNNNDEHFTCTSLEVFLIE